MHVVFILEIKVNNHSNIRYSFTPKIIKLLINTATYQFFDTYPYKICSKAREFHMTLSRGFKHIKNIVHIVYVRNKFIECPHHGYGVFLHEFTHTNFVLSL